MIDLYTWTTPNGRKASIMLEEIGLPYRVNPVNIAKDEQFDPHFLAISPNNKIPAIVDHDAPGGPQKVFESGAILVYLAEKTGKLLAPSGPERWAALEWTFWQVGGLGPMAGQYNYFAVRAEASGPTPTRMKHCSCRPRSRIRAMKRSSRGTSKQYCVWMNCAPAAIFLARLIGRKS